MSLELVNTFGTLLTTGIIAATAIAAMVQLRHLRASNQINAMFSIGNQLHGKAFRDALTLVAHDLEDALEQRAYREYDAARTLGMRVPAVSDEYRALRDAVILVGNTYEEVGILVKNGTVDRQMFLDRFSSVIVGSWRRLENSIAFARAVTNDDRLWENFEYLAVIADDFVSHHGSTYPKGVRKMQLHNPWPVPLMNATP